MVKTLLPQGSTLRSLVTLRSVVDSATEEYVRAILENVGECERAFGDAHVRISISGPSNYPHYRVDAVMDLDTGQTTPCGSFSGLSHRPLSEKLEARIIWSD